MLEPEVAGSMQLLVLLLTACCIKLDSPMLLSHSDLRGRQPPLFAVCY